MILDLHILSLAGSAPIVHSSICSVPILEFRQVVVAPTRHFKGREIHRVIVNGPVKLTPLILESIHPLQQEHVRHHGAELTVGVTSPAITHFLLDLEGVGLGQAQLQRLSLVFGIIFKMTRPEDINFIALIDCVVETEGLGAYQFIVAIHYEKHLVVVAVFMDGVVNVL